MNQIFKTLALTCAVALASNALAAPPKGTLAQGETKSGKKKAKKTEAPAAAASPEPAASSWSRADATDTKSEFFHQADSQHYELTPFLDYVSATINFKNLDAPKSEDITGFILGASGEYGINSMFAAGVTLKLEKLDTSLSPTTGVDPSMSGIANPEFYLKGKTVMPSGTLRFGGTLSLSPDKSRTGSDNSSNAYTGGHTLTPYVGFDRQVGKGIAGGRFSFDIYKTDRAEEVSSSGGTITGVTEKGGEAYKLTAFYEQPVTTFVVGGSLSYSESAKTKTISGSTTTQNDNRIRATEWKAYAVIDGGTNLTLIPSLAYGGYTSSSPTYNGYVDNVSGWVLQGAARMTY